MKTVCKALLLTCAGVSLASSPAFAQAVQGEKWKVSTSMQMGGMSMPAMSSEICKEPGDEAVPVQTEKNCEVYDVKRSGNVQSFKMRCTGKDAMEGSGEFTYLGADQYKGKMQVTTQGETMNMAYEGKKLGACDGGEINVKAKKMLAQAEQQKAQSEKAMIEECHKHAATADSPMMIQSGYCKDPADVKAFCAAVDNHEKFKKFADQERMAAQAGNTSPEARPLTETAKLCGFSVDDRRAKLCSTAEQQDKLDFLAGQCPVQATALAQSQCAGRRYTAISAKYRDFCASYATAQAEEQQNTPTGKAKGLFNKSKKALGGILGN